MNKQDIVQFFDRLAPQWDADLVRHDHIIDTILDNACVTAGVSVLDVACGTGVLLPDYLHRGITDLTAIDISPEMAKIAAAKFPEASVLCGDVEQHPFARTFDRIVIYNAFPHFPDPENLICTLSNLLNPGGILTVAHGMSRAAIDNHHKGTASKVSVGLMHEDDLEKIFQKHLRVTTKISNDHMYQLTGKKV